MYFNSLPSVFSKLYTNKFFRKGLYYSIKDTPYAGKCMVSVFPLSTITSYKTTSSNDIKFVDSIIIINGIISFVHVLPRHQLLTQFQNYIY